MNQILLIEDDPKLNQNIKEALTEEGFVVEPVFDGLLAEKLMRRNSYDCILLDINLPGKNGYDLCTGFRQGDAKTPVLMLTAFDELEDKVKGYECGADDYLTKPFYMKELVLKVRSLIKRSPGISSSRDSSTEFQVSDISVLPGQKKVFRQGKEIPLTPREYQILMKLLHANGEVVPKKELIKEIWGKYLETNTNTIEVYINFLRNKLDKPFGKGSIKTKIGFGYYFED
ncbi:response regulator transcription factor [Pleomorphovibrio marinus]|uniref:response regulator transcription factor n=1 Tax=Pleomorphovibrio marinus TaxID=2164132 RepID=UPI000E0A9139|nr:response regulator transcription factor [Pleomorphovibrio marinus]